MRLTIITPSFEQLRSYCARNGRPQCGPVLFIADAVGPSGPNIATRTAFGGVLLALEP